MKKLNSILIMILVSPLMVLAAIPETQALSKAEGKVDALFRNLKSVSDKRTNSTIISKIRYDFENNYFGTKEQHCPNEFKSIWEHNNNVSSLAEDIRPATYFNNFFQLFREEAYNNSSFSYERLNSCIVKEPEFKKNEEPAKLAQVIIRKVYSRGGIPFGAFNDTLVVGLEDMKIRAWANNASRHSIGYFGGEVLDVEQLKVSAALAYNNGQYYKAYHIYQTIVNKYPKEGDPYYRMAIILYNVDNTNKMSKREKKEFIARLGTELKSEKQRQTRIIDDLDKAIQLGGSSTRKCADNMKYWITC